jgi:hypothetical protein
MRVPFADEHASDEVARCYREQIEKNGRITNMKKTLLQAPVAYHAYMEWYTLRDEVEPFIGARGVILYCHAISTQSDCVICSTFFRRYLLDNGEDPANLRLSEQEQVLMDYGRQIATDSNNVSDALFGRIRKFFDDRQIVLLTAFAGIMIATNVLNNALRVPLDDYLMDYKDTEKFGGDA